MSSELLRVAAFVAYLAAWVVFAGAAIAGMVTRRHRQAVAPVQITMPTIVGTLLQGSAALAVTLSMRGGALRPALFELVGALVLAPLASLVFVWAQFSVPRDAGAGTLVTGGAYRWLRHPMYLAFLMMLIATGLLVSTGLKLVAPIALYLWGSEMRVASEEAELVAQFPEASAQYRRRTRWRYLPGLR